MFGRFRVLCQVGVGNDGVRFRTLDTGAGVEVDLIQLRDPTANAPGAAARAKRLRLVAMLGHPTARRVVALSLEGERPFAVLEAVCAAPWVCPPRWPDAVSAAVALAEGLAEAHKLGLTHGRLGPDAILAPAGETGPPKLDWSGLDAGGGAGHGSSQNDGPPAHPPAPELRDSGIPTAATDVYALGALLTTWLDGNPADPAPAPVLAALTSLRSADPDDRPTSGQVAARLKAAGGSSSDETSDGSGGDSLLGFGWPGGPERRPLTRERLGRFAIREKLGEGGVGAVYRAEDLADGSTVAVKVLREEWSDRPDAVRRLVKEARLLKEVNNPHVANLLEVNEDDGVHYLVLEYVPGVTLAAWISERGRLDERTAVRVMADAARGLAVAHERGVIHRDVKPENLLLVGSGPVTGADGLVRAKVSDFGLARSFTGGPSSDGLTGSDAIVGTPLYMAPEQGGPGVGPAADVYAMGATLFHALAGRPPFVGASTFALIAMHRDEPPPRLRDLNPALGEGVCRVVARSLAKRPEERYADAGRMLLDLERLLRGEPVEPGDRPRTPPADPRDLVRFESRWDLHAPPARLWPHVSNADRVNRALGAPAVVVEGGTTPDGRRHGSAAAWGLRLPLTGHPGEWLEGRRFSRVVESARGPFRWWSSRVELAPGADGGTTLTHQFEVAARGVFGRLAARVLFGAYAGRALGRIYQRIDAAVTGRLARDPLTDPFEPPHALTRRARAELDRWLEALERRGLDPVAVEGFGDFLASAPPAELASVRPLALAKKLGVDPGQVVAASLHGVKDGVLVPLWRVRCPACRETARVVGSLRDLAAEFDCPSCRTRQEIDPAEGVELVVRTLPRLRAADPKVYALCHPAAAPQVVAQVRIEAGGWALVALDLGEGAYRVRVRGSPESREFQVRSNGSARRLDLAVSGLRRDEALPTLGPGGQALALSNDDVQERVVRVERDEPPADALTATRVLASAHFTEHFPGEVLPPGRFVSLADVTLVVTALDRPEDLYRTLGDARAFARIDDQFRRLDAHMRRHGGKPVKTLNEGLVAVFDDPASAVRAALGVPTAMSEGELTRDLPIRVVVHRGPAMSGTLDGRLDYFGMTVGVATALPQFAEGGGLILSPTVREAPGVSALLDGPELQTTLIPAPLEGLPGSFAYRVHGPPAVLVAGDPP